MASSIEICRFHHLAPFASDRVGILRVDRLRSAALPPFASDSDDQSADLTWLLHCSTRTFILRLFFIGFGCIHRASDSDSSTVLAQVGLCIIGLASQSHIRVLHRGIGYDLSLLPDTLVIIGTRLATPGHSPKTSIQRQKCLSHPCDHNQRCRFDPRTQNYHRDARLDGSRAQWHAKDGEQTAAERASRAISPAQGTTKVRSPFYCQERLTFAAKLTAVISNIVTLSLGALGRHSDETRTSFLHTYQPSARNILQPLPTDSVRHIMLISSIFCQAASY